MALSLDEILRLVVSRVERAYPSSAYFEADEQADWPDAAMAALREAGFMQEVDRATSVRCDGCSWDCVKPVVVRMHPTGGCASAFVKCDEEPGHGRISIAMERLARYRTTAALLTNFLARAFNAQPVLSKEQAETVIQLTSIKGRYGPRNVSVVLSSGCLRFNVGIEAVPLANVFIWSSGRVNVDFGIARRLANRKSKGAPIDAAVRTSERLRHDQKIVAEARRQRGQTRESWTAIADRIAKSPLSKRRSGKRLAADTIRRIITRGMHR